MAALKNVSLLFLMLWLSGPVIGQAQSEEIGKEVQLTNTEEERLGWFNSTYFAVLAGVLEEDLILGFGLNNEIGYQFKRQLGLGLGFGIDIYSMGAGERLFPVYGIVRGFLSSKKIAPYYNLALGYSFGVKSKVFEITEAEGGILIHPSIGLRLGTANGAAVHLNMGYKFQDAFFLINSLRRGEVFEKEISYKRLTFRLGIAF